MGRGFFGQLNRLVKDVTERTGGALSRQQAALVRGKVAGRQVTDDHGNLLVDSGHVIDDAVIDRAAAAGKMAQLVVAAGSARMQDLKEAAQTQMGKTQGGQEARALDSVEEYAEARSYVGRYVGMDVTDVRGNVIIETGRKLSDEDVRTAREMGLLSALIFAAQQPYTSPVEPEPVVTPPLVGPFSSPEEMEQPAPVVRRRLSMAEPPGTPDKPS